MNIPTKKNGRVVAAGNFAKLPACEDWKITPTPLLLWTIARNNAKTTIPRISKTTPVLLTIATSRTP